MADPHGESASRWRRSASVAQSADGDESAAGDDTSVRSSSRRSRTTHINLSVPQPSYAYGAPPDHSVRNEKISARHAHGRSASTASAASVSGGRSASAEPRAASEDRNLLPASERYALLRAQRRNAASLSAEANERQVKARQERQDRVTKAERAGDKAMPPPPVNPDGTIEELKEELDEEAGEPDEQEEEETRHSEQGTPQPDHHRRTPVLAGEHKVDRARSLLPPTAQSTSEAVSSGLGYGAQRRSSRATSPLLPPGPPSTTGSGTGSYDYADESAMARDLLHHMTPSVTGTQTETREGMGLGTGTGTGTGTERTPTLEEHPGRKKKRTDQSRDAVYRPRVVPGSSDTEPDNTALTADDRIAMEEAVSKVRTRTAPKRKTRKSQDDTPFRPDPEADNSDDDDDDDDDDLSDVRKRTSRRTTKTRSQPRAGQEDGRIWAARSKARRTKPTAAAALPHVSAPKTSKHDEDVAPAGSRTPPASLPTPRVQAQAFITEHPAGATEPKETADGEDVVSPPATPMPLSPVSIHWGFFRTRAGIAILLGCLMALLALMYPLMYPETRIYVPPSTPPRDISALAMRLHKLEKAIGSLSSVHGSELTSLRNEFGRARADLADRLGKVEAHTTSGQKTIDALEKQAADLRKEVVRVSAHLAEKERSLKTDFQALSRRLHATDNTASSTSTLATELKQQLVSVETRLRQTSNDLSQLERARAEAQTQQSVVLERLAGLEKSLPAQMVVRKSVRTGGLEIDPSFWTELRKHVATNTKEEDLRQHVRQETLAILADPAMADKTQLVSRSDFAGLVRGELGVLQAQMESVFGERLTQVQGDMWDRLRRTAKAYTDAGSLDRTSARFLDRLLRSGSSEAGGATDQQAGSRAGSESGYGSGAGEPGSLESGGVKAVLALIDAALERYSADKLARPDYALYTIGGRVVPSLTSPSYTPSQPGWLSSAVRALSPIPLHSGTAVLSRAPVVALHPDATPGMCWPFSGTQGQLGVALFKPVQVTDITIEHVPRSLVPDARAAPREVHVWGLMTTLEHKAAFAAYRRDRSRSGSGSGPRFPQDQRQGKGQRQRQRSSSSSSSSWSPEPEPEDELDTPMPVPPDEDYMYLGTFTYDASPQSRAIQTFPVPAAIRALHIPTSVLRFRFVSNHGNRDYTCVYRVRVHGDEPDREGDRVLTPS